MTARVVTPPHAPELGLMRRLLGRFHVTGVFWFQFHRWGVSILPNWGVALFIVLFTTFFFVALRRIRAAISSNLEVILGPCGWWERQARIYRTMWSFAWCLSERYERLSTDRRVRVSVVPDDLWDELSSRPQGLVLVTAHLGHWEVGSMLVKDRHVHVVREEEMDPRAQEFVRGLLETEGRAGDFTMHFAHDDPTLGPRLLAVLRRGEFVAVQGDRPRTVGRTVEVQFFGRPIRLPVGPVALARAAGVDMVPVFIFRRGRLVSEVVLRPPIRIPGAGREALSQTVQRIASEVEWAIRQAPYQWFCFRSLWSEGPSSATDRETPTTR